MTDDGYEVFPVEPGFEVHGPYRMQQFRYKVFQKDGSRLIFMAARHSFEEALAEAEKLAGGVEA